MRKGQNKIIGLTEQHGMAVEQRAFPPKGYEYKFLNYVTDGSLILRSPLKGFFSKFEDDRCDLLEAVLSPPNTRKPWVYSLACFEEAIAFELFGIPTPRWLRLKILNNFVLNDNCKALLFWSEAGLNTIYNYNFSERGRLLKKSYVVYPAIKIPECTVNYEKEENIQILFNGNFFIKGGANVVDCFEILNSSFENIKLRLCCDRDSDFKVGDSELKHKYLRIIDKNPNITLGRVSREEFVNKILPETDIYLLPTYGDAFGFAVLEAMSYGIPVVSTNYMAIPEMVIHEESGYLADIKNYDCKKMFKGCFVNELPDSFKDDLNKQILPYLRELIKSSGLREKMGNSGRAICRRKFSFEKRSERLDKIYRENL